MNLSPVARGLLIAVTAQAVFTVNDTCAKLLTAKYSVFQVISMQALVGGGIVIAALLATGQFRISSINSPRRLAMRGLLAGFGALTNIYAFSQLPLADVYAIIFCAPLIVTALSAPLLGEHVGLRRWIAVMVGFCGMLVMVQPGVAPLSVGQGAALLSACISACVVLLLRSIASSEPRSMMVAAVVGAHFVVGLPVALAIGRVPDLPDIPLVILSGASLALGQFLMVESLRLAPAATVAPMQYTKLGWGVLIGFVLFADMPQQHVLLGTAIVVLSVVYIMWRSPAAKRDV
jgi:drug/metabolite transporter (DMT)-like permease